jgi:hypothetical protein
MLEYYPLLLEASMAFKVHSKKMLRLNALNTNQAKKKKKKIDINKFNYDFEKDKVACAEGYNLI